MPLHEVYHDTVSAPAMRLAFSRSDALLRRLDRADLVALVRRYEPRLRAGLAASHEIVLVALIAGELVRRDQRN